MKPKQTTVFLADDHTVVREGLRLLLEIHEDMQVLGDVGNGRDAVQQILELKPEVVIMDIAMPDINGIDAIQMIMDQLPEIKVMVLSMHSNPEHVFRAFKAGARGYLLKESAGKELLDAVRTIARGNRYVSGRIADIMANNYIRSQSTQVNPIDRLSMREREVMQLVVEGKSSSEIARTIGVSIKTVETYRSRLMQKLEINDIPSLVKLAITNGFISLE